MPSVSLSDIARLVGAEIVGDASLQIDGVKPLAEAGASELSFLANPKYESQLSASNAGAVLVKSADAPTNAAKLVVADPYLSLVRVVQQWFAEIPRPHGVDPTARIATSARVASTARIGAYTVVGENAVVGENVTLFEHVVVGANCTIGDETMIYPNVTLYHGSKIGRRCILHSGVVIGADGYGFATADGIHHKLPQIGIVVLGDDVEIGANSTVDRAALGQTVIGDGTKIDNLVQVAHNVKVGRHCLLVSQSGIAGSTELGDYVVLGGQAGFAGHLKIGSGVQVAAQSAVMKDFAGPAKLGGSPARPLSEHLRTEAAIRRLPELLKRLGRKRGDAGADETEAKG
jgi:UDP-3-O-[3-hydroxymyristoyl] glucosamine N-acyltransferase